ncbi:hypothetical protein L1987_16413 [Smallanthus sonchifolius]|uniref:Uncharacterized protein n=1 Tax=Smallanthus sonchifolius TaxID=185202 RepID=A0ACB9J947_9ASTR|nr:hypothetical protein L1987_16413 [Smallanthus sonchifolius]
MGKVIISIAIIMYLKTGKLEVKADVEKTTGNALVESNIGMERSGMREHHPPASGWKEQDARHPLYPTLEHLQ